MGSHLSEHELERFRRQSLSPGELVSACRHLEDCEACRQHAGGEDDFQSAFMALGPGMEGVDELPFHPSPSYLADYVNGRADDVDVEIIESHLEDCPSCAADYRHRRALQLSAAGKTAEKENEVVREGSAGSRTSAARWNPLAVLSIAVLLLALAATVSLLYRLGGLNARVSQLEQDKGRLQEEAAALAETKEELDRLKHADEAATNRHDATGVSLNDAGGSVTLDQLGNLAGLPELPEHYEELIKTILRTASPSVPANIAELAGKREYLTGANSADASLQVLSPRATAVRDDRPTFRWAEVAGSTAYSVEVFDSDFRKVASSAQTHLTEWTTTSRLERGRVYHWEVTAIKAGREIILPAPPEPPARFKVLGQETLDELRRAERKFQGSHLVMGSLSAEAGLLDEAEHEFRSLLSANPESAVAAKIYRSIQSVRRR